MIVCLDQDVNLEPGCEYLIRGKCSNSNGEFDSIFLPDNMFLCKHGVLAACSISHYSDGFVPVRLYNDDNDKILHKGTKLGTIEEINRTNGYVENIRAFEKSEKNSVVNTIKFDLSHLYGDIKSQLNSILSEYSDIFSKNKNDLGECKLLKHKIETGNAKPISMTPRRIPMALEDKVEHMLQDMLKNGVIRESQSPWCAPIVVVAKKTGDLRICVDYRHLNAVTERPIFPIPDSRQLFDSLEGAKFFSTLDFSSGYHQIAMEDKDIKKTAFATRRNQYEYCRMPFGLCGAPATFQRTMSLILRKENWIHCLIYLDDIIIFGKSIEQHNERLRSVMQRIRESGLKLSPGKCHFLKDKIAYLGHVISSKGISTDESKIDKVKNWPVPKTEEELHTFIALAGYYRRFIKNFATIVAPLEALLQNRQAKKSTTKHTIDPSRWQEKHSQAFEHLKTALTTAPILAFPNSTDTFVLDTDASHYNTGAVLSQLQDGREVVISYASNKLSKAEQAYCVTRKELFAVFRYVLQFKHYLMGRKFIIRTDHKALQWLLNWRRPNTSQYCSWKAELETYDFEIKHREGRLHTNADALSRFPPCQQCDILHEDPKKKRNVKVLDTDSQMEKDTEERLRSIASNRWDQEKDNELQLIIQLMKQKKLDEKYPREIELSSKSCKRLWRIRRDLRIKGGQLYRMTYDQRYQIIVPMEHRKQLINSYHSNLGHIGYQKCAAAISADYYWPFMAWDIKNYVTNCIACAERKVIKPPESKNTLCQKGYPFEKIVIDIAGPLPTTKRNNRYLLSIIDCFSRFPVLVPIKQIDAKTVSKAVYERWITLFGAPDMIHSDRGTNFESEMFAQLCALAGSTKTKTSAYTPQSNGIVERTFRTVKDMIYATTRETGFQWDQVLQTIAMGLRCTRHSTTNYAPFEVFFGKPMQIPPSWNEQEFRKYPSEARGHSQYIIDTAAKLFSVQSAIRQQNFKFLKDEQETPNYKVGDCVMTKILPEVKNIYSPRYEGPHKIIQIIGNKTYAIQAADKIIQRHVRQIKHFRGEGNGKTLTPNARSRVTSIRTPDRVQEVQQRRFQRENPDEIINASGPRYPLRNRQLH